MVVAETASRSKAWSQRRHMARLAAVQALYQIEITGQRPAAVVLEFHEHRRGEEIEGVSFKDLDEDLFNELVVAVSQEPKALDALLSQALAAEWPVERLERLLRIILRLGAYELLHAGLPPAVAIDEAVELARRFGSETSPAFINGVLDSLARDGEAEG